MAGVHMTTAALIRKQATAEHKSAAREPKGFESPGIKARLKAGRQTFAASAAPKHNRSDEEQAMSEPASIAGAVDESTRSMPKMGQPHDEINGPDGPEEWQHISSPVGRIVANVLRRMAEREAAE